LTDLAIEDKVSFVFCARGDFRLRHAPSILTDLDHA
jgi:hypothetical protein